MTLESIRSLLGATHGEAEDSLTKEKSRGPAAKAAQNC